ncbi:MAG: FMN-binding protein [Microbacteriaceae bacterium]
MRQKRWRGTALFVGILAVLGLTSGMRLSGSGPVATASALTAATAPANPSATSGSPAAKASATPAAPASAAPAAPASNAVRTINGTVVQTPYGPVQVAVTFRGKTITGLKELQSPSDRGRSIEINSYAAPMLAQEVLKSQSARINTVSGATYTSDGYAQSVQSAIDQL